MEWYEEEADKYNKVWDRGYGGTDPRSIALLNLPSQSKVLDIGCGCGEYANSFSDYTGVDISESAIELAKLKRKDAKFFVGGFHDLSRFSEDWWGLVLAIDVLEHLPPGSVEECLSSLSKLKSNLWAFNISTRPSNVLDTEGGNLHLTVWTPDTWRDVISKFFSIEKEIITHDEYKVRLKSIAKEI